ncbi:MAG: gamma-glutamyltransferase [Pseudomonadales bacterium]
MLSRTTPFCTLLLVAVLGFASLAHAETSAQAGPIINFGNRFLPDSYKHGVVVAAEKLAADVGVTIMQRGGNAIDAAVATGFALAVTYPSAGNLAGGGFMLIHKDGQQHFVDYRETAPRAAFRDMYLDENGEVNRSRYYASRQSAGVPGTVAGMIHALEKYGTMTLSEVIEPAIELADKGFEVSYALAGGISRRGSYAPWSDEEAMRVYFRKDGTNLQPGDWLKQGDLAWTLKQIKKKGRSAFYEGKVAKRFVADMEANDGLITLQDLADYKVHERTPVRGRFLDFEVLSAPPPSSGGVHILQMLNIMENFELRKMGHNSAEYIHHLAESMKFAYADRSQYLGDPDYFKVPVAELTSKSYAREIAATIKPDVVTPSAQVRPGALLPSESQDTTHYSVVDRYGNVVSNTYTLNFSFGSGIVAKGTGMLLNNEMADFSARPGHANPFGLLGGTANAIEPGKRPLSSMSPTIVFKDDKPWLVTGSPGGSLIITSVLQVVLNATVFGDNVATAAALPRVHHQWMPDKLRVESGVSVDTLKLLGLKGHTLELGKRTLGRTQSIMIDPEFVAGDGYVHGASDTRRPLGAASGY